MAHFSLEEAQAWLESTKLVPMFETIDGALADQVSSLVLSQLSPIFDTTNWVSEVSTPKIVRSIIAMHYVAWMYDKVFSADGEEVSQYAMLLRSRAEANIAGLLAGNIILPESPDENSDTGTPVFFPNDASSANPASTDFPYDGDASFMMGMTF